ncbi:hypothetical protein U27_06205 [Candidatus Vecturithrix granuli]|uniref:Uncharacterized protein n=1 Tax=Vecturithrix granuli TaxID=1499967 RepID=A0A081C3S3_VECG1|nr:hypothetical protein U27_06205 [Candidatus Vecturithrix granuli]
MTSEEIQYLRTFSSGQVYFDQDAYGEPGLWIDVLKSKSNFSDYFIVLNIEKRDVEYVKSINADSFLEDTEVLSKIAIHSVNLRKIISYPVFEVDKEKDDISVTYNLSLELYTVLRIFWRLFHKLPQYKRDIQYYEMCPGENAYFDIFLGNAFDQTTVQFIYLLKETILNYEDFKNVEFLKLYYLQNPNNKLWKTLKVSEILPSNTKSRRLGYLKLILDLFEESDYYPLDYFSHKVEQKAKTIRQFLSSYKNDKGVIETSKSGISAKPYIDLTENLALITQINRSYILTKQSKIYRVINTQLKRNINEFITQFDVFGQYPLLKKDNPFELTVFEKAFFLHQILLKDALYFEALIEMIYLQEGSWIEEIKQEFQQYILNELYRQLNDTDVLEFPGFGDPGKGDKLKKLLQLPNIDRKKILQIIQRIRKWQPDKYLPHVIEPRINWLLDLDLLDSQAFDQKSLKLSNSGQTLFNILISFYDMFLQKSTMIDFIIQNHYFQIINNIYNLNFRSYTQELSGQIGIYLDESFKYFKTIAPNSISAFQAIYYVCYKFLLKDSCIIEFTEVKKFLENRQNLKFSLDWYAKEQDGSLQKRR